MSGLLRSNLVVAAGTALSRLTGLLRVAVFAIVVGQSALADAYQSANQSPNAVYELLLGGVLSASLVPLFTRQAERRDDDATSAVVTVCVLALTAVTALSVAAAPWVFRLFSLDVASGVNEAEYRAVGTALARIFLIQVFFYGVTAIATALLQARRRFFAAAWAPVLSNLVIVASLLMIPGTVGGREPQLVEVLSNDRLRMTLALGATIGIAVMAAAMLPALRSADVSLEFRPEFRHPAVRQLISLSGWSLGYVVANQVSIVVILNLARPGSGSVNAYALAYVFFVLPHGLLAMSVVTTFTPEMARSVQQRDREAFISRCSSGVRLVALLTFPAAAGLFVLRRPLIGVALDHGQFDSGDAALTSRAMAGFALGLVGFSVYLFVLRGFYAHTDARTPFTINLFENLINIVLAVVLVDRYGVLGLAASFAIAYALASIWALQVMAYKVPGFSVRVVAAGVWKMALAAVVMAEAMWLLADRVGGNTGVGALLRVAFAGTAGIAIYLGLLVVLRVPELHELRTRISSRFT
ncbi:MAG: murein biosynthesis integral membrane protein MurJ [Actinomycetota bacterium]